MSLTEIAFSQLTDEEMELLGSFATCQEFQDGEFVFKAGDIDVDVFVVKSGALTILNPSDNNRVVTTHYAGHFSGDIDVLTRRPIVVTGVASGTTRVLRVANEHLREVLMRIPRLSEKLLSAFQSRRELLSAMDNIGLSVLGPGKCRETTELREFLYKNFVPFTWYDSATERGQRVFGEMGNPIQLPAVRCTNGNVLSRPSLHQLAVAAGVWKHCPSREVDFAIIGAGPSGVCAAVYAASEGLSTLVLDRLGPGGQVAGSSRIENFIGFPSGLSGADFATRGVLQMLKFGACIVAPVMVHSIKPASADHEPHRLELDCGAVISARVLLIATGVRWRKLDADRADRFERAGVYYACTTVEAHLHDETPVAVVGGGNSAGQATVFLAECCPRRKVHLIVRSKLGPSMSDYLCHRIRANPNVIVHEGAFVTHVHGDSLIDSISLTHEDKSTEKLDVTAVFVFIGSDPSAEFLPDSIARDEKGFVLTGAEAGRSGLWPRQDREPCALETSVPGILAAGDIRSGSTKRVGFAVGDGSLAVTCVHKLLAL